MVRKHIYVALLLLFIPYSYHIYFYPSVQVLNSEALNGKDIFQKYNCIACHQIYGLGGYIGPDLTNVYSRRGDGYIKFILKNGLGKMPVLNISEGEAAQLAEFFKGVDTTGKAPYTNAKINWNGTVEPQ